MGEKQIYNTDHRKAVKGSYLTLAISLYLSRSLSLSLSPSLSLFHSGYRCCPVQRKEILSLKTMGPVSLSIDPERGRAKERADPVCRKGCSS